MPINNNTIVSEQAGSAGLIDYTIGFRLLLQLVERIAVAQETVAIKLTEIAAEEAAQTVLVERIAVADEGVWQCCRSGRGDQEAFVEINMRHHNEPPEKRWDRYESFLMRDAGIPNGAG